MVKINEESLEAASNSEGSRGGKKKEVVSQEEEKYKMGKSGSLT